MLKNFLHQTARELAQRGAFLILGCRSRLRGLKAVKEIVASTGNTRVEMMDLDLTSLASVHEFAKSVIARPEPLQVTKSNSVPIVPSVFPGADQQCWYGGRLHFPGASSKPSLL